MGSWTQIAPTVLATFLASLVEFVEALTIILAVGATRGWEPALKGTALGVLSLVLLIAVFGPALSTIPIANLQFIIGVLLLLFGFRWLRKAILRSAGVIPLHDEDLIYEKQKAKLSHTKGDIVAMITAFKATLLEGLEVVFIVLATSAGSHSLMPGVLGALLAGAVVGVLGYLVHKPLARVPENALKFSVGLILSSFGIYWIGEGLQVTWPGEDLFVFVLFALLFLVSACGVVLAKNVHEEAQ